MIRDLSPQEFPPFLSEIPEPPSRLRLWGNPPNPDNKLLCVVGSRKYSHYGREAVSEIIAGLTGYPVTIVSGLALGIDGLAHRAAIKSELQTIALPGSGLDRKVLHPHSHYSLAEEIVENGGGIMSEYDDEMPAGVWTFPQRNRIMAGMCHATIVVEAEMRSGTLITSRLATEYNREVGAIPGPISSPSAMGPHMLLRLGAALIRDAGDVLELLGLEKDGQGLLFDTENLTNDEKVFIKILDEPCDRDTLIRKSKINTAQASAVLSLMEIKGLIKEELGEVRKTF